MSAEPARAGADAPLRTKVKICGITRPEDGLRAAELGAWAVGFVFHPESPRCVTSETAVRVAQALPSSVLRVGVFLDQPQEDILRIDAEAGLDLIQLHGAETNLFSRVFDVKRCVKTVFLRGEDSVTRALEYEAEYLLVDRPRSAPVPSREGVNWDLAARLASQRPRTVLAGALDPLNVDDAVRKVRPWGVDVSSGLERSPGIKDAGKMRDFFAAIRRAEETDS